MHRFFPAARLIAAAAVALFLAGSPAPAQPPASAAASAPESAAGRDSRMAWWREARFGLFIHWGLYAIPGGTWDGKKASGTGEWILQNAKITVPDYEKLLPLFNPVEFDAKAWAKMTKDAGMRYLVITSKHHDGFCLWDSKETEWDVAATPFKRDILAELADACRAEGIRFCVYHSIMDWHHLAYLPRRPWDKRPTEGAGMDAFVPYLKAQLAELVQRFRPAVLWFDGEWEDTWDHARGKDLARFVRGLDPAILVNNRVDKGRKGMAGMTETGDFEGDFGTPEQEVPPNGFPGVDWESCMTMNDTWGWRTDDQNWKSEATLVRTLVETASKGGNFLLNVGPTPQGTIPQPSVERLQAIGRWLQVNGESIYGTQATPFKRLPYRCTTKPGRLYVHLSEWPKGRFELPGFRGRVTGAWLLADPARRPLAVQLGARGISIAVPEKAPDPHVSVVVVGLDGPPSAEVLPVAQREDGSIVLAAADAEVHGEKLRLEPEKSCLGFWTDAAEHPSWEFEIVKPGLFDIGIETSCEAATAGTAYTVEVAGLKIVAAVRPTKGWNDFTSQRLGRVRIDDPGRLTLAVKAAQKPPHAVMNLRSVTLSPVK